MPRTCIICGKRAGSREHTFPRRLEGAAPTREFIAERIIRAFRRLPQSSPTSSRSSTRCWPCARTIAIAPSHFSIHRPKASNWSSLMAPFGVRLRMRSPANGAITFNSALAGQRGSGPSLISPCRSLLTTSGTMRGMAGSMTSRPLYKGIARTHSFGGSGRRQQQCCRPIRSPSATPSS